MKTPAIQDILCIFATLYMYSQHPNALFHRQQGRMRVFVGEKLSRWVEGGSEKEEGGGRSRAES